MLNDIVAANHANWPSRDRMVDHALAYAAEIVTSCGDGVDDPVEVAKQSMLTANRIEGDGFSFAFWNLVMREVERLVDQ